MSAAEGPRLGFFGKLPSHGDFIRWGLSRTFVSAWDAWLQTVWSSSADEAPIAHPARRSCRFFLGSGLCGPSAVSGVLLPSADKVGRRFPLLVAVEGSHADAILLDEFERVGRDAISEGFTRDELAARLQQLQLPVMPIVDGLHIRSRWQSIGAPDVDEYCADYMPSMLAFATFGIG